jgi:hypothetical protein
MKRGSPGGALSAFALVGLVGLVGFVGACGGGIPRAELERCRLGQADGNDAMQLRQGAACRVVAQRYASDERPGDAMSYALKACELEDGPGCEQYLALVRAQPSLAPGDLLRARSVGERACAGMVVGAEGADVRASVCARTAELFADVDPRSPDDADRLYGRACTLGNAQSCAHASPRAREVPRVAAKAPATAAVPPAPPTVPTAAVRDGMSPTSSQRARNPAIATCHEMRDCVALDVKQRNTSEVVGTLVNRCDRAVSCTWCPSRGNQVDKSACRSATLAPSESRSGSEKGLWYEGFNGIAYDCMDAADDKGCIGI